MEKPLNKNFPLPNGTELMSYQIEKMIARGGSSFVYLAKGREKKYVAIKEFLPHKLPLRYQEKSEITVSIENRKEFRQCLKTFFSERRTLLNLTHPGVVRPVDFFRANNTFYMVTQYEPGICLNNFILRRFNNRMGYTKDSLLHAYLRYRHCKNQIIGCRQVLGEGQIKKIFSHLIDVIKAIHEKEFLYLDLKPANIYLLHDGTPLLLDLGAARGPFEKNGRKKNWVSTPGFAAPELLEKQKKLLGPWTDAYGIGATIFACMCGFAPQSAKQRGVRDSLPACLKSLRKIYSGDLVDLVEWCMNLNLGHRPQTMAELGDRLLACQFNSPPIQRRRFIRRFSQWMRRKIKFAPLVENYDQK